MRLLVFLTALLMAGILPQDPVIGTWTGTSICQVKNSSCRDEIVVFHFAHGNGNDTYIVRADKIVNGKAIDMGELDFIYNRVGHTLTCAFASGTWVLVVDSTHIDGTLTTPDKVLYKKLTLTRQKD